MDLLAFITSITQSPEKLSGIFVYTIVHPKFSDTFCYSLAWHLKQKLTYQHIFIVFDLAELSLDQVITQLHTRFLGIIFFACIYNSKILDNRAKIMLLEYVQNYNGPHTIVLFAGEQNELRAGISTVVIEFPESVTPELYSALARLFYSIPSDRVFIQKLFEANRELSFDKATMILNYQRVLGKATQEFLEDWLPKIIEPEVSLFKLSQHLFARQQKDFFALWMYLQKDFPEEFWIVYWSEQLWQALVFTQKLQETTVAEAKKAVSRLPFSFINKDHRNYSKSFLVQAHHFLYKLDSRVKLGMSSYGLELFYAKFFLKDF